MAETLQLHLSPIKAEELLGREKSNPTSQVVVGMELDDGQALWTPNADHLIDQERPGEVMALDWPIEKAERTAEYFEEFVMHPDIDGWRKAWNCHSLAAHVMDWPVLWKEDSTPYNMPIYPDVISPDDLEDHVPYAILNKKSGHLSHSMMGLPDPTLNIGVWGFRKQMRVATNANTAHFYRGRIYEHSPPVHEPMSFGEMAVLGLSHRQKVNVF